jgi:membrane protein DedA with SNARE-associated domain
MLELNANLSELAIYITLSVSMFFNGLLNFPSSQIVYLTLGYLYHNANFNIFTAILLGTVFNTLGNLMLYKIVQKNSNFLNTNFAKFMNMDKEKLDYYVQHYSSRYWMLLILGKVTPSVKVFVPVICGLANISFWKSFVIFLVGSFVWAIIVTYAGYYFGQSVSLLEFYGVVFLIYIIVGFVSYAKLKQSKQNK